MNHLAVSTCPTSKRQYLDQAAAKNDLARIKSLGATNKIPKRAYKCDRCECWHLTSQEHRKFPENDLTLNTPMVLPFKDYLTNKSMSKSSLDLLDRSPAHFKYAIDNPQSRTETPAMRMGSLIHKAVLEPDEFNAEYAVMPDGLKKPTSAQINAKNPSDKSIKQVAAWQEFTSTTDGKIIISENEMETAFNIRKAVMAHSKAKQILDNGVAEQSIFWKEPNTGVLCKARADWIHGSEQSLLVDIKTTNDARLHSFRSSIRKYRYNVQAGHYSDGFGIDAFCFIAVEKEPPYGVAVYVLNQNHFDEGLMMRDTNLNTYAECMATDYWPCYSEEILTI